MILRELVERDVPAMVELCGREWVRLGVSAGASADRFRDMIAHQRYRIVGALEGGQLVAVLVAHPIKTDQGPGYTVRALVVDHVHPDTLLLLDAVALYACSLALSEGRRVVVSEWSPRTPGIRYGRDVLGFETVREYGRVRQTGDAQAVVRSILGRRPEWRLP